MEQCNLRHVLRNDLKLVKIDSLRFLMKFAQGVSFSKKVKKQTGIKLVTLTPGYHGNGSCDFAHCWAILT